MSVRPSFRFINIFDILAKDSDNFDNSLCFHVFYKVIKLRPLEHDKRYMYRENPSWYLAATI